MSAVPSILGLAVAGPESEEPRLKVFLSPLMALMSGPTSGFLARKRPYKRHGINIGVSVPHKKQVLETTELPCPCQSWKQCDWLYQMMTEEQRLVWRKAIKKPHMSGYDLWMKECVSLSVKGKNPPDLPSVSGGYSTALAIPGTTWLPPDPDMKPWVPPPTPVPPPVTGACCLDWPACVINTEAECTELGGNWLGPDTSCDDCPPPPAPPGHPCWFCEAWTPSWVWVTVAGLTDPQHVAWNGLHKMLQVSEDQPCTYFDELGGEPNGTETIKVENKETWWEAQLWHANRKAVTFQSGEIDPPICGKPVVCHYAFRNCDHAEEPAATITLHEQTPP